jgi:hypothetical protein
VSFASSGVKRIPQTVTFTLRVGKVRFQIFKTRALEAAGLSE